MTRDQLLKAIDRYIEREGISARKFSVEATGDSGFVSRLRNGKANITLKTMERIVEFIDHPNKRQGSESENAAA